MSESHVMKRNLNVRRCVFKLEEMGDANVETRVISTAKQNVFDTINAVNGNTIAVDPRMDRLSITLRMDIVLVNA